MPIVNMLGFHVTKDYGIARAKATMDTYGFTDCCFQLFVTGPASTHPIYTPDELASMRRDIATYNVRLYIHGSFLDNPWKIAYGAIHNIKKELAMADIVGARGVVIHIAQDTLDNFRFVMDKIFTSPSQTLLFLEIHAHKSSKFAKPEELNVLLDEIRKYNAKLPSPRIGLCIDTAHVFVSGVPLYSYEQMMTWLVNINHREIPTMMHLNDCFTECGSGKDIHAPLTQGTMWSRHDNITHTGLAACLEYCAKHNIDIILERKEQWIEDDLALLSRYLK